MSELRQAAQAALEALAYHVEQTRPIQKTSDAIVELRAALAQPPAPTAQPAAPFLFIAMDDDRRASVTWCANEAAVREAAKRSMFWLQPGEQLSAEHANELDGCVDELLESGAMHFEGDPPLYLYRVGRVAQPVQQPGADVHWCATWLRNNYQDHPSISGLCDAMKEAAYQAAPAQRQPLSEDADGVALRRAVANDLTVRLYGGTATAQGVRPGGPSAYETEADHSDPCAAARRAIHRAADIVEGRGITAATAAQKGEKL